MPKVFLHCHPYTVRDFFKYLNKDLCIHTHAYQGNRMWKHQWNGVRADCQAAGTLPKAPMNGVRKIICLLKKTKGYRNTRSCVCVSSEQFKAAALLYHTEVPVTTIVFLCVKSHVGDAQCQGFLNLENILKSIHTVVNSVSISEQ